MDDSVASEAVTVTPVTHFLLGMLPYNSLVEQKNVLAQKHSALESIVATANMNPKVLMKESVLERRKILIRIDATSVGESFLNQVITENNEQSDVFQERLVLGQLLQSKRKDINTRLYLHQVEVDNIALSRFHYLFLSLRQIKLEHRTAILSYHSFVPASQKDYNDKLVLSCLLDEFVEVRNLITEEMRNISQK